MDYVNGAPFPNEVQDILGNTIDIKKLTESYQVILITLKSTKCAVCPPLLKTINRYGLNDEIYKDKDKGLIDPLVLEPPVKDLEYYRLLLKRDTYFIILSPGPLDELQQIQKDTNFENFPFILDEDLNISGKINMRLSSTMIWPAIIHIESSLRLRPINFGRAPGFYGITILMNYLHGLREKEENQGLDILQEAELVLNRIKKKIKLSGRVPDPTNLSVELWLLIFTKLNPIGLAAMAQTCRTFSYLSLLAVYFKIIKLTNEVKRLIPKDDKGTIVSHSLLNQCTGLDEVNLFNKIKISRLDVSIIYLRDATNLLRSFISSYMILGDKELLFN